VASSGQLHTQGSVLEHTLLHHLNLLLSDPPDFTWNTQLCSHSHSQSTLSFPILIADRHVEVFKAVT